jgi:hypothetical protein
MPFYGKSRVEESCGERGSPVGVRGGLECVCGRYSVYLKS